MYESSPVDQGSHFSHLLMKQMQPLLILCPCRVCRLHPHGANDIDCQVGVFFSRYSVGPFLRVLAQDLRRDNEKHPHHDFFWDCYCCSVRDWGMHDSLNSIEWR